MSTRNKQQTDVSCINALCKWALINCTRQLLILLLLFSNSFTYSRVCLFVCFLYQHALYLCGYAAYFTQENFLVLLRWFDVCAILHTNTPAVSIGMEIWCELQPSLSCYARTSIDRMIKQRKFFPNLNRESALEFEIGVKDHDSFEYARKNNEPIVGDASVFVFGHLSPNQHHIIFSVLATAAAATAIAAIQTVIRHTLIHIHFFSFIFLLPT